MNRRKRLLLTPLALVAVFAMGTADAGQSGKGDQPYSAAPRTKQGTQGKNSTHWQEHFQGKGNVTNSRCLGMSRGPDCITATSRKDAARRAAAARAAAQGDTTIPAVPVKSGNGGHKK
jgi:hypothetical protein